MTGPTNGDRAMKKTGTPHDDEVSRLRRIEGQVRGLQRMIEGDRYCIDILTQVRSVQRAIDRVADSILARHMRHCVAEAMRMGDLAAQEARLEELVSMLDRARR